MQREGSTMNSYVVSEARDRNGLCCFGTYPSKTWDAIPPSSKLAQTIYLLPDLKKKKNKKSCQVTKCCGCSLKHLSTLALAHPVYSFFLF